MENTSRSHLDRENQQNPSPNNNNSPSPNSNGNNGNLTNNNNNQIQTPKLLPNPRSESSNPYPTTFVQADTSNFKHVVQMLTGSSESSTTPKPPPPPQTPPSTAGPKPQDPFPFPFPSSRNFSIPPIKTAPKKQQSFKLYERRNNLKNSLMINTLIPNFTHNSNFSPRNPPEILSPSLLDFPSLALSPVTPLNDDDPFDKSSPSPLGSSSEEERAIAEKGFYLHPNTPRGKPQLLSLFPETSPRASSGLNSSSSSSSICRD